MIERIEIHKVEDITKVFLDQKYNNDIKRYRSNYLYRGISDTAYKLETTLKRTARHRQRLLEGPILSNFTKYAINEDPDLTTSVWRQMIVGQHHGLPTRLLDWTHSSLIALHFATSEQSMSNIGKRDGIIWRIDAAEIASLLPDRYRQKLKDDHSYVFNVNMLDSLAKTTEQYDKDMEGKAMVILEPPSLDQRIVAQYSYFTVVPDGLNDIEKFLEENTKKTLQFVIDKQVRWDIRDYLDQLNISERMVYPGLDGLTKWIARHYYVKDELYEEENED